MGSFTFCYIKPHIVRAGGTGILKEIIQDSGFQIVYEEIKTLTLEHVVRIYPHIVDLQPDFQNTETALSTISGPSDLLILWHAEDNAAKLLRKLIGFPKYPDHPEGEGIRGTYALGRYQNAIHGSDSERYAFREMRVCVPDSIEHILADTVWKDRFYEGLSRAFDRERAEIEIK